MKMSDILQHSAASQPDGPDRAHRRKIARATVEGHVARLNFGDGVNVEVDTKAIPASIAASVMAYGVVTILQTAYSAADDPIAAAQAAAKQLLTGNWQPGRVHREREPDILIAALAAHLGKTLQEVEEVWLPMYMRKRGFDARVASRHLRAHPEVAKEIARIMAERARRVAGASKSATHEKLDG